MDRVTDGYREILGNKLVGVYVHGSAAFGCFRWEVSDIDFLAVVNAPLTQEERVALIRCLLWIVPDAPEKGLEMSVVTAEVCRNFVYPTPFELHFSNSYLEACLADAEGYCARPHGGDPDLAGHFAVTRACGIAWYGAPIEDVFAPVPRGALMKSILNDVADAQDGGVHENPVYFVLNLCRTIACAEQGLMLSKAGGGQWALEKLPEEYHPVIRAALNAYTKDMPGNFSGVDAFNDYAQARLASRRTLYVSDLDGTLLGGDARTSAFTNDTINRLVGEGVIFSYATARSFYSSSKVTAGLNAAFPVILYNGAMMLDNASGERLMLNNFSPDEAADIRARLTAAGVSPIVYAFVDGRERFSVHPEAAGAGVLNFCRTRSGDVRERYVHSDDELYAGEPFYFTCIGEGLEPLYETMKDMYHCVYQIDLYDGLPWLEIMPRAATKANAALQLKQRLGCGRIVAFGDGINDIELFRAADEAYAVANAVPELIAVADGVIGSNDEGGVAKWLAENAF